MSSPFFKVRTAPEILLLSGTSSSRASGQLTINRGRCPGFHDIMLLIADVLWTPREDL